MPTSLLLSKWVLIIIGFIITSALGFSSWAATSIYNVKQENAVQAQINIQMQSRMDTQGATIATFQNILGDIREKLGTIETHVEVTRTMLEERTR